VLPRCLLAYRARQPSYLKHSIRTRAVHTRTSGVNIEGAGAREERCPLLGVQMILFLWVCLGAALLNVSFFIVRPRVCTRTKSNCVFTC